MVRREMPERGQSAEWRDDGRKITCRTYRAPVLVKGPVLSAIAADTTTVSGAPTVV
jgi:hypothetical protein